MIGPGLARRILDSVIVLAAEHPGRGKPGPEFDTPDGGYGKYGMTQHRFHRVEKMLSQSDGKALCPAFDDAANGILCFDGFLQPFFQVLFPPDLQDPGLYGNTGTYPC